MKNTVKTYFQPAFLICFAVLIAASGGMSVAVNSLGVYLKKEPCPLKKSLDLLDEKMLKPYQVIEKAKIENKDIVEALGTKDYIQWSIVDPQIADNSPVKRSMLFITYYELADQVPHVPEECYGGAGFQQVKSEAIELNTDVADIGLIEARYLVFARNSTSSWQSVSSFPIVYLFRINGEYANSREQARTILGKNIFGKRSYFCKIEIVFNQSRKLPTKEQSVKSAAKLFGSVFPVL